LTPGLKLGDMMAFGDPPAKMWKALAVIAADLHPTFKAMPNLKPDISRESCVLCSLTVRDFLHRIGFKTAFVAPVVVIVRAVEHGKELHSAGIGVPGTPTRARRWNGHLVVIVPDLENYLIDTTLYQINRPQWRDLPGMLATPLDRTCGKPGKIWGLDVLGGMFMTDAARPSYEFIITWLANPSNAAWKNGPDASRNLRRAAVNRLVHEFGPWRDK